MKKINFEIEVLGKSETLKALSAVEIELQKVTKEKKALSKVNNLSEEEYAKALEQVNLKLEVLRRQKKDYTQQLKYEAKEITTVKGSMEALRVETAKMEKELNNLDLTTEGGRKRFEELKEQVRQNREEIIAFDQHIRNGKSNVGLYTESIQKALEQFYALGKTLDDGGGSIAGYGVSINGLKQQLAALEQEAKSLDLSTDEGKKRFNDLSVVIGNLKGELNKYETALQQTKQSQQTVEGSIASMREQMKLLQLQIESIDVSTEEGRKEYQETAKAIVVLKESIEQYESSLKVVKKESKAVQGSLEAMRKKAKELNEELEKIDVSTKEGNAAYEKKAKTLKELNDKIGDYERKTKNVSGGIKDYIQGAKEAVLSNGALTGSFGSIAGTLSSGLGAAAIGTALVEVTTVAVQAVSDITKEFTKLRGEVALLSGDTGEALDKNVVTIASLAATYGKSQEEITVIANAMAKNFNIPFSEALEQIKRGFISGADIGDEFIDIVKEYPAQFAAAKFSAEDFIDAAIAGVDFGVYKDKGIDAVKEFGISVSEQTTATREAFEKAFGVEYSDEFFQKIDNGVITTGQALEEFVNKIRSSNLPLSEQQTLIADVFRGTGEDAQILAENGLKFLEVVVDMRNGTKDLTKEQEAYLKIQEKTFNANERLATAKNELTKIIGSESSAMTILATEIEAYLIETLIDLINAFQPVVDALSSIFEKVRAVGAELFGLGKSTDDTTERFSFLQIQFEAFAGILEGIIMIIDLVVDGFVWLYKNSDFLKNKVDLLVNAYFAFWDLLQKLPFVIQGVVNSIKQMGINIQNFFKSLMIDLEIAKKQLEKINPFGESSKNVDKEIEELRKRKAALKETGKSLKDAFNEGYAGAVKGRETKKVATVAVDAMLKTATAGVGGSKDAENKTNAELKKERDASAKESARLAKEQEKERQQKEEEARKEAERLAKEAADLERKLQEETLKIKTDAINLELNAIEDGLERETALRMNRYEQEIQALQSQLIVKENLSETELAKNEQINRLIAAKKTELNKDLTAIDTKYRKEYEQDEDKSLDRRLKAIETQAEKESQILAATITDAKDLETAKQNLALETAKKKLQLLEQEALASEVITTAQLEQIRLIAGEIKALSETPQGFDANNFLQSTFGVSEEVSDAILQSANDTATALYDFVKKRRDEQIENEKNDYISMAETVRDSRIKTIEEEKAQGLITEEEYIRKKEGIELAFKRRQDEAERKAFEAEKKANINRILMETAVAAIKLWVSPGFPAAIPMSIALGVMSGLNIAEVKRQKYIPKAARGMFVKGPNHAAGGVLAELEGGEAVVNKSSLGIQRQITAQGTPLQIVDAINRMGGGVSLLPQNSLSVIQRSAIPRYENGGMINTQITPYKNASFGMSNNDLVALSDMMTAKFAQHINSQKIVLPVRHLNEVNNGIVTTVSRADVFNQ